MTAEISELAKREVSGRAAESLSNASAAGLHTPRTDPEHGCVLVVCTGNVCRSPYMERRLRQQLDGMGIEVLSAGTGALVGSPIQPGSAALLAKSGADIEDYQARQLTKEMVVGADLILTAAREHRSQVVQYHPRALAYTFTWGDFADLVAGMDRDQLKAPGTATKWIAHVAAVAASRRGLILPGPVSETDVPDPYRQDARAFAKMAQIVEARLPGIVAALTPPQKRVM